MASRGDGGMVPWMGGEDWGKRLYSWQKIRLAKLSRKQASIANNEAGSIAGWEIS